MGWCCGGSLTGQGLPVLSVGAALYGEVLAGCMLLECVKAAVRVGAPRVGLLRCAGSDDKAHFSALILGFDCDGDDCGNVKLRR